MYEICVNLEYKLLRDQAELQQLTKQSTGLKSTQRVYIFPAQRHSMSWTWSYVHLPASSQLQQNIDTKLHIVIDKGWDRQTVVALCAHLHRRPCVHWERSRDTLPVIPISRIKLYLWRCETLCSHTMIITEMRYKETRNKCSGLDSSLNVPVVRILSEASRPGSTLGIGPLHSKAMVGFSYSAH